jgi:hypothetical protein
MSHLRRTQLEFALVSNYDKVCFEFKEFGCILELCVCLLEFLLNT